jgi:hypothetical protein
VDDNNFAYVAKLKWSNDDRISVGGGMYDDVDEGMGRMAVEEMDFCERGR